MTYKSFLISAALSLSLAHGDVGKVSLSQTDRTSNKFIKNQRFRERENFYTPEELGTVTPDGIRKMTPELRGDSSHPRTSIMIIIIEVRSSIKVDFTRKPQNTPLNPPPPPPLQKLLRL
jgi:hypothetical protein